VEEVVGKLTRLKDELQPSKHNLIQEGKIYGVDFALILLTEGRMKKSEPSETPRKAEILMVGYIDEDGWPRRWHFDCEGRVSMLTIDPGKTDMDKIADRIADLIDIESTLFCGYTFKELRDIAEAKVEGTPWRRITIRDIKTNELWSGLFELKDGRICSRENNEYHSLFKSLKGAEQAGFTLVEVEIL